MKKLPIFIIIILLAVLAFFLFRNSDNKKTPEFIEPTTEDTDERTFIAKVSEKTIIENESEWTVNAVYPVSSNSAISTGVETTVQKIISDFKETDFGIELEEGFQSTLGITYTVTESQKTVSYVFTVYSYSGGAHGITSMVTRVYDIEKGAELALRDVFVDGFFTTLREELRAKLIAKLGENSTKDAIESGTSLVDYIANFYLTDTAIGFVFSSYSVGPYAIGTVDVQIPFTDLKSVVMIEKIK